MVEVLVAILVLCFGMLGMVGLQAAALRGNREARAGSVAVAQARELAEMMRGNKDIALLTDPAANPYLGNFDASPLVPRTVSDCLQPTHACTSRKDVADAQMTDWLTRVSQALPGARVKVCFDTEPYDAAGRPKWDCTGDATPDPRATIMVKMAWTQSSTNRTSATPVTRAADGPLLVFPLTPGNTL